MTRTVHYTVGHNIAGYSPEADVVCFLDYAEAREYLIEHMKEYADSDDDGTQAVLDENIAAYPQDYPGVDAEHPYAGDENPAMLATVQAILVDDPPPAGPPSSYSVLVSDGRDRPIVFWLNQIEASDCDYDHEEDA